MSEPTKNDPQKIMIPLCPHCEQELGGLGMFHWSLGPAIIVCIHCPHCRKALHFDAGAIPPQQSQILA
jgi:hypothetical protein